MDVNRLPTISNNEEKVALRRYCLSEFRDINLILREKINSKYEFDKIYKEKYGEGEISISEYYDFINDIKILDGMFKNKKGITKRIESV